MSRPRRSSRTGASTHRNHYKASTHGDEDDKELMIDSVLVPNNKGLHQRRKDSFAPLKGDDLISDEFQRGSGKFPSPFSIFEVPQYISKKKDSIWRVFCIAFGVALYLSLVKAAARNKSRANKEVEKLLLSLRTPLKAPVHNIREHTSTTVKHERGSLRGTFRTILDGGNNDDMVLSANGSAEASKLSRFENMHDDYVTSDESSKSLLYGQGQHREEILVEQTIKDSGKTDSFVAPTNNEDGANALTIPISQEMIIANATNNEAVTESASAKVDENVLKDHGDGASLNQGKDTQLESELSQPNVTRHVNNSTNNENDIAETLKSESDGMNQNATKNVVLYQKNISVAADPNPSLSLESNQNETIQNQSDGQHVSSPLSSEIVNGSANIETRNITTPSAAASGNVTVNNRDSPLSSEIINGSANVEILNITTPSAAASGNLIVKKRENQTAAVAQIVDSKMISAVASKPNDSTVATSDINLGLQPEKAQNTVTAAEVEDDREAIFLQNTDVKRKLH